ncbi:hypothetical protein SCUP234_12653 [Seiridium cupressi]
MGTRKAKNKEYYAVLKGRVDGPTIFSSWGDTHPRVTGCVSIFKGFRTLGEARTYLEDRRASEPQEILKNEAGETTPIWNSMGFYAVANGERPGIYNYWYGDEGSEPQVKEVSSACHQWFRTLAQAEAFIEDWKESFSDLELEPILSKTLPQVQDKEGLDDLKFEELNLKEKKAD